MTYDFDEPIDRVGTHSYKLDELPKGAPGDALPFWVADMDLPCAEPIIEALHERVNRRIFGYTLYESRECKEAITGWYSKRFDWKIDREDIFFSPGVVPSLAFLLQFLTKEGDGVIIQRPVYYPFTQKIEENKRVVVNNALIRTGDTYEMDFEDLDRKFADSNTKGMILCSPHNPVGRVWKPEELRKVAATARKYKKWIISDEIHCDLTRKGIRHIPLLKAAEDYKDQIIACTAPSKTFNLAGMQFSNIVIPNKEYQKKWLNTADSRFSVSMCSPFGLTAAIAAYTKGEEWLNQARTYIDGNIRYIGQFVRENLPKAQVIECQGTYLVWIDLNRYCSDPQKLERLMQQKARLAFDEGYIFGPEGSGYERINAATQRSRIVECMNRMEKVLTGAIA